MFEYVSVYTIPLYSSHFVCGCCRISAPLTHKQKHIRIQAQRKSLQNVHSMENLEARTHKV